MFPLCRPASVRWHGLEKISGYSSHLHKFEAPRTVAIACFYIAAFLFFEMAWEYCSDMLYPEQQGKTFKRVPNFFVLC